MTAATPLSVLSWARVRGVRVEPNGPKLRVVAPDDLPEEEWAEIREALIAYKPAILEILTSASPTRPGDLSLLRGGPPSLTDDSPIVIDRPDRRRMLAAVAANQRPAGPPDMEDANEFDGFPWE